MSSIISCYSSTFFFFSTYVGTNEQADREDDEHESHLESGPKFHINQRVLVLDSTRSQQQPQTDAATNQPPLYEATIKRSDLRHVDPVTGQVLSETKFAFAKKRGRRCLHSPHAQQQQHSLQLDQEKEWCYLIHFQGWNSRHDRWMTEAGVFPNTDENKKRVQSAAAKVFRAPKVEPPKEKKKKGRPKKLKEEEDGNDTSTADSYVDMLTDACALPFTLQTILVDDRDKIMEKVYPPSSLSAPSDPVEMYNRSITMLHELPSKMNIRTILARFVEAKKREDLEEFARERERKVESDDGVADGEELQQQSKNTELKDRNKPIESNDARVENKTADQMEGSAPTQSSTKISSKAVLKIRKKKRKEIALSIIELVDAALPKFLLYTQERPQFAQITSDHINSKNDNNSSEEAAINAPKQPSELYGGEHLLRLFVKLPSLLTNFYPTIQRIGEQQDSETSTSAKEEFHELSTFVSEFIVFLQKNRTECFKERYFAIYADGKRCDGG